MTGDSAWLIVAAFLTTAELAASARSASPRMRAHPVRGQDRVLPEQRLQLERRLDG
jgi:hypothetical protein